MVDGGVPRIDGIELRGRIVGRAWTLVAFARLKGSRRGDQRYPALGKRLLQRLKRRFGIMGPAIGRSVSECLIIIPDPLHVGDRGITFGGEPRVFIRSAHLSSHNIAEVFRQVMGMHVDDPVWGSDSAS